MLPSGSLIRYTLSHVDFLIWKLLISAGPPQSPDSEYRTRFTVRVTGIVTFQTKTKKFGRSNKLRVSITFSYRYARRFHNSRWLAELDFCKDYCESPDVWSYSQGIAPVWKSKSNPLSSFHQHPFSYLYLLIRIIGSNLRVPNYVQIIILTELSSVDRCNPRVLQLTDRFLIYETLI